ncbi:peptidoglycan hydrolase CwlO-like protein [Parabacteroides sp. PFB2-12]|uniref:hypothetical protein n=1 Tax=unclassified Parabacteroides TaxID=2649774 RepID=UPI00247460EA|nr:MULTISPECIES: hypothetical protein [unclassified Parabacteroides]MDH6343151.1 peptidoglycan hydrolase CwlO-like protein [Parabacteroides sp. PM6-13]MDH6390795.1 peptidoglycan hydrolase CwlO-like protein [Parabacteroides sp. PFB2-12]
MSYIEVISNNISTVKESYETVESMETQLNKFLDIVLDYQASLKSLYDTIDELTESIIKAQNKISIQEFYKIEKGLVSLHKKLVELYVKERNDEKCYLVAKSYIKNLHCSINNLKESIDDFRIFRIELDEDREYEHFVNIINDL